MRLSSNVLFFLLVCCFLSCASENSTKVENPANTAVVKDGEPSVSSNTIAEKSTEAKNEKPPASVAANPPAKVAKEIVQAEEKKGSDTKAAALPKSTPKEVEAIINNAVNSQPKATPKGDNSKVNSPTPTTSVVATKPNPAPKKEEKPVITKPNHKNFGALLKKYVSASGDVNYKGLKADYESLKNYLSELAKETPKSDWSRNEKLAYWINAYNAFTIDLILNNYPVSKITDLDGGSPWKVSRIDLEGKKYSLDQIENKIIRPQFKDARIHFAVNCAAKSCPTLLNDAFYPNTLNSQLESQTKKFINNPAFNKIENGAFEVSKIFEWYAEDFGDLISYLNKYSNVQIDDSAKAAFKEYDWSLNGQ